MEKQPRCTLDIVDYQTIDKDNYTKTQRGQLFHRLSAVRSHVIFYLIGILVLLPYYKS